MKSLNQGKFFTDKKSSFQNSDPLLNKYGLSVAQEESTTYKNIREGFKEGMTDFKIFDNQAIDYHGGANKGTYQKGELRFMSGTLDKCKEYIKGKGSYLGLEYMKLQKKCYFLKQHNGDLPKNGGKIPTLKHKNGVITYLKLNNGMPESEEAKVQGDDEISQLNTDEKQEWSNLENQFNTKLNQYSSSLKKHLDASVTAKTAMSSNLRDSVREVQGADGIKTVYYITGHGVKRKFDSNVWRAKHASCPDDPQEVTQDQLNELPTGADMKQGEECRTGGYNVSDGAGTYYVDKNGLAHQYSNFLTGRHSSCPGSVETKTAQYVTKLPKGKPWTKEDDCLLSDSIGTTDAKEAETANQELISLVGQMKTHVEEQDETVLDKLDSRKAAKRKKLITTLTALKKERAKIRKLRQQVDVARYNLKDKKTQAEGIQIKYIAWTLAGATLISMVVKMLNK
jgi:hypothetical protein